MPNKLTTEHFHVLMNGFRSKLIFWSVCDFRKISRGESNFMGKSYKCNSHKRNSQNNRIDKNYFSEFSQN